MRQAKYRTPESATVAPRSPTVQAGATIEPPKRACDSAIVRRLLLAPLSAFWQAAAGSYDRPLGGLIFDLAPAGMLRRGTPVTAAPDLTTTPSDVALLEKAADAAERLRRAIAETVV